MKIILFTLVFLSMGAFADVLNTFESGDVVSASKMNENFQYIKKRSLPFIQPGDIITYSPVSVEDRKTILADLTVDGQDFWMWENLFRTTSGSGERVYYPRIKSASIPEFNSIDEGWEDSYYSTFPFPGELAPHYKQTVAHGNYDFYLYKKCFRTNNGSAIFVKATNCDYYVSTIVDEVHWVIFSGRLSSDIHFEEIVNNIYIVDE